MLCRNPWIHHNSQLTALPGGGRGVEEIVAGTNPFTGFQCGPVYPSSTSSRRSMRRKLDMKESRARSISSSAPDWGELAGVACVETESKAPALREALVSHQLTVQELQSELEEERSAAASAATEAMSMIVRLQHDKAEAQMEARQFKRLAEEKMSHDQQMIAALEDLVFQRDHAVKALFCEIHAYRHRLLIFGIGINGDAPPSEPQTPDADTSALAFPQLDLPQHYPPLKCTSDPGVGLDMYSAGEMSCEPFQKLGQRIFQRQRMPTCGVVNAMDEGVVVGPSPRARPRHIRAFSNGSYGSGVELNKGEESPAVIDRGTDYGGRDDMNDRIYTVDAVHGASEDYVITPREHSHPNGGLFVGGVGETEIRKLYMRLQALEAERKSMKQTFVSMGTNKAQMAILKEIVQQICKEGPVEMRIVKKPSSAERFSFVTILKSVILFAFWLKISSRVSPARFTFGLSARNAGLLLLLDRSPRMRHRRVFTRTHGLQRLL